MHRTIHPSILYVGTPVVLIGTVNEDGTPNLAPISSAWWQAVHHSRLAEISEELYRPARVTQMMVEELGETCASS